MDEFSSFPGTRGKLMHAVFISVPAKITAGRGAPQSYDKV